VEEGRSFGGGRGRRSGGKRRPLFGRGAAFRDRAGFQGRHDRPSDPLVGLPIPGATPAEHRANLLWNMRAGLNVAALQCQFSPYLRAVDNYNGILAHHSEELASAYTTLNAYFKRVQGNPRKARRRSTTIRR
jgi:hypothetical protein